LELKSEDWVHGDGDGDGRGGRCEQVLGLLPSGLRKRLLTCRVFVSELEPRHGLVSVSTLHFSSVSDDE